MNEDFLDLLTALSDADARSSSSEDTPWRSTTIFETHLQQARVWANSRHRERGSARETDEEEISILVREMRGSDAGVYEFKVPADRIEETKMAKCVLVHAKTWRLPAFDGEPETVRVPLEL